MEETKIVMDYEKKYNEALKKARRLYEGKDKAPEEPILEYLFPELRESEDERIRKEAISIVKSYMNICEKEGDPCLSGYKVLAYLEKQKEQREIPLMNGDADLYFDNWIQHNDTTKRGCFEEGIRYAQRLQKEQDWNKKPCLTCQEYEKGHKQGYTEGCTAGYNKAMKEVEQKEQKPEGVYVDCTEHPEWYGMPQKPHCVCLDTVEAIDKVREFDEQAEEDLALTAEDVSCIIHLADQFGKDYQRIADVFNKDRKEEDETQ